MLAICAALVGLLALPSPARAQTTLTERLRVQGIYSIQTGAVPPTDLAVQAVPELSLLDVSKRSQLRATYIFAATAHSAAPTDIANRLALNGAFDLSKRTSFLLSAEAGHTTVTSSLVLGAPANAPAGPVPLGTGQLFTSRVGEGVSWEASPRMRFTQLADATYITTIDPPPNGSIEAYLANGVLSLDRAWPVDAIGMDLRGGYAEAHIAPLPASHLVPLALTPHWRHDLSRTLTSLIVAGATVVVSPDPNTKQLAGPYAQAKLNYLVNDTTFDLLGLVGTTANAITAQLLYADQVTFRTTTVLSVEHHLVGSAGVGYTHGSVVDLRRAAVAQPDFDAFIADTGVTWTPAPAVDLFVRYQFIDQVTESTAVARSAAVLRHAVILGIQLSSRPDTIRVPTGFPQRVDRGDAAVGTSSGTTPAPSSSGAPEAGGSSDGGGSSPSEP